ncbi:putative Tripeptidyl-peptidase sed1 [Diplogelasinospora grovesii]|uniref:tripeptidyl-peptidase II n=1 Tax=Diplogelasinospora grovesii TaxID=303347 RepID=A0AAN6N422_9PEZI|nr:putative Tripeptidyl-peptidase sed1 [Diplogelasinospora grovesii]
MLFRCLVAALGGGLALQVLASPLLTDARAMRKREVPGSHILHERHMPHIPQRWTKRDKLPDTVILPMRIGLKQSNLEAGRDRLVEISTPGTVHYGKHMTAEEVIDFFAPPQASVDVVTEWLVGSGFAPERISQSVNKQWIQFDATVEEAEDLLFTEYHVWEHSSGSRDISGDRYHVPGHVQEHIDYVTPGARLRLNRIKDDSKDLKKRGLQVVRPDITKLPGFPTVNSTSCDVYVTADCTRVQYSIPNGTTAAPGNELGIFESLDDHYSKADLDVYFSTLYPYLDVPKGTYPEERLIDGAVGAVEDNNPSGIPIPVGLESSLDFDSAWPLIWPQKTVLFQEDDEYYESTGNFNGFFNTFLDAIDGSYCTYSAYGETGDCTDPACLDPAYPDPHPGGYKGQLQCGVYKPTNVISISYGGDEYGLPDSYLKRQCDEWMKLSLQGVTIVTSSGDSGVGPDTCNGADGKIFDPGFPVDCPYVLAVGSTEWNRPNPSAPPQPWEKLDEIATRRFPSGGGFSNIFGVAGYQRDAVKAYFDQVEDSLPFKGYHHFVVDGNFSSVTGGVYHHGGRAYPDVAAVGDRQVVYANGSWWLIGGTSLSSPVWGAVLTLVNEQRIAAGKGPVGYIHPTLYAHPEAFTDITVGSNPGCGSPGFPAAKGWDPVSGLGSPNFPVLLKVLLDK